MKAAGPRTKRSKGLGIFILNSILRPGLRFTNNWMLGLKTWGSCDSDLVDDFKCWYSSKMAEALGVMKMGQSSEAQHEISTDLGRFQANNLTAVDALVEQLTTKCDLYKRADCN